MKSAPKVVVGSLGTSRISRINGMKRIIYEADLQVTKPGDGSVEAAHMTRYISLVEENGEWHIEGFYKSMPDDK